VDADPIVQNLRRVMWSGGDTSAEMKVYITTTVNFGDKPAGCIAIVVARETAAMDEGEFREAAWFLQNRTYVDDDTAGADSMDRLEALSGEMEAVAKRGGFEFKETLMSGDKEDENGEPHKVLGLIWDTEADRLRVDVKLNLGAKRAGLHLMENIELSEEPEKALPEVITKRELWRVAQGQYDPLGLLCAFTIRFKILMRSIVGETSQKVTGWDDPVPAGTYEEFRKVISHLGELRAITIPRAAKPKEEVVGKPMLLIFGDGSTAASCALTYLRWQMADGTVQCRLLAGKTRVAPKCKISIPRMELVGALLAVRLARKIQDSLQMELEAVRYFTDSTAVLGMILRESATYQEFVGTRVSEIRTKSEPETEWFLDPRRDERCGHGYKTHRVAQRHGARHTVPGGASVDEGVSGGVAGQEDVHATPARGVQERHAGHGQDRKGTIRTVVPAVCAHASQTGACVRLRVYVPRQGKETR
jgi:hypothetical protein